MSLMVVIGCQWGDEGKGKIVDVIAREADMVARYQGGNNAGHTIVVGDKKTVLHLIPLTDKVLTSFQVLVSQILPFMPE